MSGARSERQNANSLAAASAAGIKPKLVYPVPGSAVAASDQPTEAVSQRAAPASAPGAAANRSDAIRMNTADIRFLVIEDQDFQRALLVHMLAGLGAKHISEAVDGYAALDLWKKRQIDVIITDLDLPRMDGMEFIRHIGEEGLPVAMILTTVHDRSLLASVGAMAEAYGISVLGTIAKPVTIQKLEALLDLYQPPASKDVSSSLLLPAEDFAEALAGRQFEPLFQPKVDVASGMVKGAEALARWFHPQHGMLGPHAFIAALETDRRIDELTWMIFEKAAAACRDWRAAGLDWTVSVNLSLATIINVGLADRIGDIVQAVGLQPRNVILEVTETVAVSDMVRALENLARLRIKGFGLSIDDYGTGYSSMQQLSRIPFTELKIDQTFVMKAIENESCRVILESSLDIARKLGIKAVAEGVETHAQWELLKTLRCDLAQGYYFAKPMSAEAIVEWAAKWTADR